MAKKKGISVQKKNVDVEFNVFFFYPATQSIVSLLALPLLLFSREVFFLVNE